jgi:hypothetical protein
MKKSEKFDFLALNYGKTSVAMGLARNPPKS